MRAFARPEPFVSDDRKATKDDDVFHFITYVPFGGRVYEELDGLRPGPCDLGEAGRLARVARSAIQARIEKYSASEIKFNLMAIIRDKRAVLQEKRALLEAAGDAGSVAECDAQLAQEVAKREMWSAENVRRHHNYVPLVVDLFKVLAEKGKLQGAGHRGAGEGRVREGEAMAFFDSCRGASSSMASGSSPPAVEADPSRVAARGRLALASPGRESWVAV